jgi:hypothetical protein
VPDRLQVVFVEAFISPELADRDPDYVDSLLGIVGAPR